MALIGTHQINLRLSRDTKLDALNFDSNFEFNEIEYSLEKSFGTDTWVLNVGKVFSEILSIVKSPQNSNQSILISNLGVVRFKKGIMQWSTHEVRIEFDFELKNNGNSIKKGKIEGTGSGSGTEFGILTFIPVLGNINFDKGIEVALYRSIESGLERLAQTLQASHYSD